MFLNQNQLKVITSANDDDDDDDHIKNMYAVGAKRGKSYMIVLVLLLIGQESGASFLNQITKHNNAELKLRCTFRLRGKTIPLF